MPDPEGTEDAAPEISSEWRHAADALFGERLPVARRYAGLLVTAGAERGLIGPGERDRVWERHLLNSAVLSEAVAAGEAVVDVGSGAGLPGIPLALAREDLRLTLVEPMERRCVFLREVVRALDLADRVAVVRGRAPDCVGQIPPTDYVVARAVAPLNRLVWWTMPLCRPGGRLLALRGRTAEQEIGQAAADIARAGGRLPQVKVLGQGLLPDPATAVEVTRSAQTRLRRGGTRHARGPDPD